MTYLNLLNKYETMIIEVDIRYLSECKISTHQYVILKLANEGNLRLLEKYLKSSGTFKYLPEDLNHLYDVGFIETPANTSAILSTIKVSDKFKRLFLSRENSFEEFYEAYPVRVLRPDGTQDYLRVDSKRSKLLYQNIVGNDLNKHQLLMECLKREVEDRTKRGQLGFMKRMTAWLSSESWKVYADSNSGNLKSIEEIKVAYGQEIE